MAATYMHAEQSTTSAMTSGAKWVLERVEGHQRHMILMHCRAIPAGTGRACGGACGGPVLQPAPGRPSNRQRHAQWAGMPTSKPGAAAAAAAQSLPAASSGGGPATAVSGSQGGSGGALAQAVHALKSRLEDAVLAELQEQQRQQAAAYTRASAQRLQADGLVLVGLLAAPQGRQAPGCRPHPVACLAHLA